MGAKISLKKGDKINLSKDHGLVRALIELTFDVDPSRRSGQHEYEVNVCGFEVSHDAAGKAFCKQNECYVFYNNPTSATGAVTHEEDGGAIGDDKMDIDFNALDKNTLGVDEVAIFAEIYEGVMRGHHFGQFAHCTVHIMNPDTKEVIAEFKLADDDADYTGIQLGSFTKENGHWHFTAVGAPFSKGQEDMLEHYGLEGDNNE